MCHGLSINANFRWIKKLLCETERHYQCKKHFLTCINKGKERLKKKQAREVDYKILVEPGNFCVLHKVCYSHIRKLDCSFLNTCLLTQTSSQLALQ